MAKTTSNKLLISLIAILLILVVANVIILVVKNVEFSGHATSQTGYVNITITTSISVNMTRSTIDWGSGVVADTKLSASLNTTSESAAVSDGNWSTDNAKAFILQNIGNINASLVFSSTKTAATFLGGTGPKYQWNFTNKDAGSCTGGITLAAWTDVNSSATPCLQFGFLDTQDELYIDISLLVPYDAAGTKSDIITATASTAA